MTICSLNAGFRTCACAISLLLVVLALFSNGCGEVWGAERTVGVKAGDKAKYGDFLALWGSYNPAASVPLGLLDVNNTLWVENTVLSVSGTSVTFKSLTHYKNGTEVADEALVDVRTGVGTGNMTFVSAGLAAGDSVYTYSDFLNTRLNSTFLRAYVGLMRETNLLNVTYTSLGVNASQIQWNEFYWDSTTGILVEQFWSFAQIDEDGYLSEGSTTYRMIDNSIWVDVADEVPPVAVAGSDQAVDLGVSVNFDGGGSRDNVGIARFVWSFDDGATDAGMQVSHVYAKAGVYNVTLTVEDAKGNVGRDFLIVTVREPAPFQVPAFVGVVALLVVMLVVWLLFRRR